MNGLVGGPVLLEAVLRAEERLYAELHTARALQGRGLILALGSSALHDDRQMRLEIRWSIYTLDLVDGASKLMASRRFR